MFTFAVTVPSISVVPKSMSQITNGLTWVQLFATGSGSAFILRSTTTTLSQLPVHLPVVYPVQYHTDQATRYYQLALLRQLVTIIRNIFQSQRHLLRHVCSQVVLHLVLHPGGTTAYSFMVAPSGGSGATATGLKASKITL